MSETPGATTGTNSGEGTRSNANNNNSGRGNGSQNNRNRGNQGRGHGAGTQGFSSNNAFKSFKGEEPDIGAVLGIASEQTDNKDRFKFFQEKLLAYIKRCGFIVQ